MGRFIVNTLPKADEHLKELRKSGNKAVFRRIDRIYEDLENHPETGIGRPERLKHARSGQWAREIDKKNRMIYEIEEMEVTVWVVSAKGHYGDH